MIIEQKKLFFRTISIVLDDESIPRAIASKQYDSIVILSYVELVLPNFTRYSKPTLCIDLQKEEDAILSGFNDTTRNEIRKTYKISELQFVHLDSPRKESYALYQQFEYSQGRVPVPRSSLDGMMSFEARHNNEIISCIYVMKSGTYLRVRSIFSKRIQTEDKQMYTNIGYATRRLVWNICVWGKEHGYILLDLASVNVDNPKTRSIAQFKMSFGKELVPEYTYIYKTQLYSFFELFAFIRLYIKRILSHL